MGTIPGRHLVITNYKLWFDGQSPADKVNFSCWFLYRSWSPTVGVACSKLLAINLLKCFYT